MFRPIVITYKRMTGNDAELKFFLYVCSCKAPTPDSYSSVVGYKSDNQMRRLQTIILLLALPLMVVAQRPASQLVHDEGRGQELA